MSRHTYDCHVRFSDVDVYGHVNNVKYFEYFQEARLASCLAGPPTDGSAPTSSVVVARVDVDYKRPILFRPEPYAVGTWVTRVGSSSFTLAAEIKDGETVLSARRWWSWLRPGHPAVTAALRRGAGAPARPRPS